MSRGLGDVYKRQFISRVREFVYKYDYNKYLDKTEITAAELFNDAGIVGAALY
mgnify:FL=1